VFAVDITFQGDAESVERVFVRRPYLTIGPADSAHLVIAEMANLGFSLQVQRDVARSFKVSTFSDRQQVAPIFVGGTYEGRASIDIGVVKFDIVALDLDLLIRDNEPLDKAGVRILRRACGAVVPEFPALVVTQPFLAVISFCPDQPVSVGRSRSSGVRLDLATVSQAHARVGFESGQFWIEDLGSTNGTFVNDRQVSSRSPVAPGSPIYISKAACIFGVNSREQLAALERQTNVGEGLKVASEPLYPSLVSVSTVARPSRLVLKPGMQVEIGRDPGCGLWLGAPHISRRHCVVEVSRTGEVRITDSSTNGTAFDGGVLKSSESFKSAGQPLVLDFGAGVSVALCFSAEHERLFLLAQGSPLAFKQSAESVPDASGAQRGKTPRERKNTTWFNMEKQRFKELPQPTGKLAKLRAMWIGLTFPGRVALIVIVTGFLALFGVVVAMVVSAVLVPFI
jgi:pSer/pThr/pTyr-binding forkhead associated (FHA) protein